jgi:hypothetical protein
MKPNPLLRQRDFCVSIGTEKPSQGAPKILKVFHIPLPLPREVFAVRVQTLLRPLILHFREIHDFMQEKRGGKRVICAQKLSTHPVDNYREGVCTLVRGFSTTSLKVGSTKPKYYLRLYEAILVQFSTGYPHPSHIVDLRNTPYF